MKNLSKIKLKNVEVLTESVMKMIFGGSGSGGVCDGYAFICGCNDGTGMWCANYGSAEDMHNALMTYCSGSGGLCLNYNP